MISLSARFRVQNVSRLGTIADRAVVIHPDGHPSRGRGLEQWVEAAADLPGGELPFPPGCARRFVPRRLRGSGGFGAVWEATQVDLDRTVAVKILLSNARSDPELVRRFLIEARVTASLNHPNIVKIIDHDVENGFPWIAYEFLPGRSLREILRVQGRLPWKEAVAAAIQVARALAEAHRAGILHRDIKPENVVEDAKGCYKVTDFGVAKWLGNTTIQTAKGIVVGTPTYLSPEHIRGQPLGLAADQYSLGVMLFELVAGRLPFEHGNLSDVIRGHLLTRAPRPSCLVPTIPHQFDEIVLTMLAKKPENRFPAVSAALDAMERLLCRNETRDGALTLASGGIRRGSAVFRRSGRSASPRLGSGGTVVRLPVGSRSGRPAFGRPSGCVAEWPRAGWLGTGRILAMGLLVLITLTLLASGIDLGAIRERLDRVLHPSGPAPSAALDRRPNADGATSPVPRHPGRGVEQPGGDTDGVRPSGGAGR